MNYKILKDGDRFMIVVEGLKNEKISEASFVVESMGNYSTLKNHINMCEDIIYNELNKDIYELNQH
jgi:hypothetical protein